MTDFVLKRQGVAHDINGLMARASLIAEQLSAHRDAAVASRAAKIENAINQATEICRRELSGRDVACDTSIDAVDVDRLLNQIVQLVGIESNLAERPIDFFISVAPDVELVTDGSALFRILFNLVLNAANAIAAHGGSWIEISVMSAWGRVFFDLADDGPGLPQHVLDYLYPGVVDERRSASGPIGTGLVSAASLAKSIGGELKLVKSSKAGAQFCLTLPTASSGPSTVSRFDGDAAPTQTIILGS
ncbi:MAG: HAMP domain-containing sensor histidine kinase [Pseudomonadota bacterium]